MHWDFWKFENLKWSTRKCNAWRFNITLSCFGSLVFLQDSQINGLYCMTRRKQNCLIQTEVCTVMLESNTLLLRLYLSYRNISTLQASKWLSEEKGVSSHFKNRPTAILRNNNSRGKYVCMIVIPNQIFFIFFWFKTASTDLLFSAMYRQGLRYCLIRRELEFRADDFLGITELLFFWTKIWRINLSIIVKKLSERFILTANLSKKWKFEVNSP